MGDAPRSQLDVFLAGLIGQPCWRVDGSYGDQLVLDLGARRPGKYFKARDFGEWRIGSQGSDWEATQPSAVALATSLQPIREALTALKRLESATVQHVSASEALVLRVGFDDGIVLEFRPSAPDEGVPHWEVWAPDRRVLIAGPGCRWLIKRSDVPRLADEP